MARLDSILAKSQAQRARRAFCPDARRQLEGGRSIANQRLGPCCPKRSSSPQNENRLEQAGLARGVFTADQIAAVVQRELGPFDAAKILDADAIETHRCPVGRVTAASALRRTWTPHPPLNESGSCCCRR